MKKAIENLTPGDLITEIGGFPADHEFVRLEAYNNHYKLVVIRKRGKDTGAVYYGIENGGTVEVAE